MRAKRELSLSGPIKRALTVGAPFVGAGIAIASFLFGPSLCVRVLDVETRAQAATSRDATRIELQGAIRAIEIRQEARGEKLSHIEKQIEVLNTNVTWIKEALRDAGYRAPKKGERE